MIVQVGSCDRARGLMCSYRWDKGGATPCFVVFCTQTIRGRGGGLASRKMINFRPSETTFRIVMNWLPHVHTLYVHVLRHSHTWLISNIH